MRPVQFASQKISLPDLPKSRAHLPHPRSAQGAYHDRRKRGTGCGGRGSVGRGARYPPLRQSNPTGKSLPIYGNRVNPQIKKYFAFPEGQTVALICLSRPTRGALAIVSNVRWDAVDVDVSRTKGIDAYGEDVWS
jgi:hypothetical protein